MYDYLPNPWESLPELVIPEMDGDKVKITKPPGL